MDDSAELAALQREHDMYLAQGRNGRAAEVAAELARHGVTPVVAAVAPDEPEIAADVDRPRARKRPPTKKA